MTRRLSLVLVLSAVLSASCAGPSYPPGVKQALAPEKVVGDTYVFKNNYYFFAGDNVMNSRDSRYDGFVPEDFVVGVFEGGGYMTKGCYRPYYESRMLNNTAPEFCPVCRRSIEEMIDFYVK